MRHSKALDAKPKILEYLRETGGSFKQPADMPVLEKVRAMNIA